MTHLKIHDWEEHQTYRNDRPPPPWIKVHRRIFMSRKWARLTDAEKGQLVSLWIVAADADGKIPHDPFLLRKIAMLDEEPNINKFIELGLMTPIGRQDDAKTTPAARQDDVPEAEAEAEAEKKNTCAPVGARFDEWYTQYPKKKGKAQALKAWKRKKLDKHADAIIADTMKRSVIEWRDPQFIPMASTYINQERWLDEDFSPSNVRTIHRETPPERREREAREYRERVYAESQT